MAYMLLTAGGSGYEMNLVCKKELWKGKLKEKTLLNDKRVRVMTSLEWGSCRDLKLCNFVRYTRFIKIRTIR